MSTEPRDLIPIDRRWMQPMRPYETDRLLYDGDCALCHGAVKFILEHDRSGRAFRFSPLQSQAAAHAMPPGTTLDDLPDSMVVVTARGEVYTRSDAALYIGMRLGGAWRLLAMAARVVPSRLRDVAYDTIARIRYRVFGKKEEACPMLPPAQRQRFDFD